jgi:hypothetical protein
MSQPALITEVFLMLSGDSSRMRETLQDAHNAGMAVAPPQESIVEVFDRAAGKPGCNVIALSRDVIRAHVMAFGLDGAALTASNEHFVDSLRENYL